jgi:hypothetical protein
MPPKDHRRVLDLHFSSTFLVLSAVLLFAFFLLVMSAEARFSWVRDDPAVSYLVLLFVVEDGGTDPDSITFPLDVVTGYSALRACYDKRLAGSRRAWAHVALGGIQFHRLSLRLSFVSSSLL